VRPNLCTHRHDCKKHDEIRIFATAVTGSPRNFEKEFAHLIAPFSVDDARSTYVGVMKIFAQMVARERQKASDSIKNERISTK
jgi:hypothetical protein